MQKVYKFLVLALVVSLVSLPARSQQTDTTVTDIQVDLLNLFNQKVSRKYKVAAIKVTGNRFFDENLLLSIANINVGDEINIPDGDNFSKAISKLWAQNYFSNVEIFVTKLEGKNIDVEIAVTERVRLSKFYFKNIPKGQAEELSGKTGLIPNRVITENMKISAVEAIKKFYGEKGFRDTRVTITERKDTTFDNTMSLDFVIDKGPKVKINNINLGGNTIDDTKLKKQFKDTKEKSRFTLHPV
jgi:outer membrane protein insertion porin family